MEIKFLGQKIRIVNFVIIIILGAILGKYMWCGCTSRLSESFSSDNNLRGSALDYSIGNGVQSSWDNASSKNKYTSNDWYKSFEHNTGGKVPLPDGQLSMFYDNKSSPNCCSSTYSTSTGCVCATSEQMKYLNSRGGNRTLNSEY